MKQYFIVLANIILFLSGCSPWKKVLVAKGNRNDAIKNAVSDFLHTPRFFKKDTVFDVMCQNIDSDILGITILGNPNKVSVITENEIEYSYKAFPTRYVERDGKLFYWNDSTVSTPSDLVKKLSMMNRIDTAILHKYLPPTENDDAKKGVDYYFCKSNLKRYKRVYTRIAMGWYIAPNMNCK